MKVRLHLLENRPWLARVLFSFTVVMALCVRGARRHALQALGQALAGDDPFSAKAEGQTFRELAEVYIARQQSRLAPQHPTSARAIPSHQRQASRQSALRRDHAEGYRCLPCRH
jgi:hypothetical protein